LPSLGQLQRGSVASLPFTAVLVKVTWCSKSHEPRNGTKS
jgi:hypothetical protein